MSLLKEMLTEIEAMEWSIYFKKRAEEMNEVREGPEPGRKHLFVFR